MDFLEQTWGLPLFPAKYHLTRERLFRGKREECEVGKKTGKHHRREGATLPPGFSEPMERAG